MIQNIKDKSCFSCKTIGNKIYGKCSIQDDLTSVLEKVKESQAIILGSPIYFGSVTGEMRSFMERLFFPYLTYTNPPESLFLNKINAGFIYTMNIPEEDIVEYGYNVQITNNEHYLKMLFGSGESLLSCDTYQSKDYSQVLATRFNAEEKAKRREEVFPQDLKKAFEMGVRFAKNP